MIIAIFIRIFFNWLQADLEEEKAQEIAKLQDTLLTVQIQVEEANARVIKEREAAQKAIEEAPPVIKETPVIIQDTEKINSLMAEINSLKVVNLWLYWWCTINLISHSIFWHELFGDFLWKKCSKRQMDAFFNQGSQLSIDIAWLLLAFFNL